MPFQRTTLLSVVQATTLTAPAFAQSTAPQLAQSTSTETQAAKPDADMARVLAALQALGPKQIETLTPPEARRQYGAADAVKKVIKDEDIDAKPHDGLSISKRHFADMGAPELRYYTPDDIKEDSSVPVIVYSPGGDWVNADLDTDDASASALAQKRLTPSWSRLITRWRRNISFRPRTTPLSKPKATFWRTPKGGAATLSDSE